MGWQPGTYEGTWHTGSGIRRQEVVASKCLWKFGLRGTHVLKSNSLGNVLGIEWVTGTNYVTGVMAQAQNGNMEFTALDGTNQDVWNASWDWQNCQPDLTIVSNTDTSNFQPAAQNYTPTVKNIDWRIAVAVGIVVVLVIYIIYSTKK
jgi:hypothetical protein